MFASACLSDLVAAFLSHTHALGMTKGKQYNTSQQLLQENNNISQQLPAHDVEKGIWEIGNVYGMNLGVGNWLFGTGNV